ncbi:hypothetical protein Tdes44962_MAKER02366 [Teratosphaeria destructans]|uniref:Secreted protein n=1 Tax=Teratosphaeria destructans TaxID=418781 RepID=A0A9W7SU95_9PEZI|nr:hypothetical protein Tdes44962_MAKER02366 [Teratosphaeria destructans]
MKTITPTTALLLAGLVQRNRCYCPDKPVSERDNGFHTTKGVCAAYRSTGRPLVMDGTNCVPRPGSGFVIPDDFWSNLCLAVNEVLGVCLA